MAHIPHQVAAARIVCGWLAGWAAQVDGKKDTPHVLLDTQGWAFPDELQPYVHVMGDRKYIAAGVLATYAQGSSRALPALEEYGRG